MDTDRTKLETVTLEMGLRRMSRKGGFGEFCRESWHVLEPGTDLVWNWHLDAMSAYLEAFAFGDIKRLILNVCPGAMKSLMVSVFLPAWTWTWKDSSKFINLTNEVGLAIRDSRRMKDLITSEWYQDRWPHVKLSSDQREKSNFENVNKGFRQGLGMTGNISGKRGNFLLIDDPIDTKKAFSDIEISNVNDTYDQAVSSRLNDLTEDGIVLIMQRTRTNDLTGHLLSKTEQHWVLFKVPMESEGIAGYDPLKDLGTLIYDGRSIVDDRKKGELFFPERFPLKAVNVLKEDLGDYGTAGQLQQRPSPLGGGIIKKDYWSIWPDDKPIPQGEHLFISWDTAYTEADVKNASYSAATVWGVFWHEQKQRYCLMVLARWYGRVAYPDLRLKAMAMTERYEPDCHLIEKKASGISLISDLKRAGSGKNRVRLRAYTPDRDKMARAYASTATLASGLVFIPNRKWAFELIDQVASFPAGAPPSADLTDTVTQAILYLKKGWWVSHPDDDEEDNKMVENASEEDYEDNDYEKTSGMYG